MKQYIVNYINLIYNACIFGSKVSKENIYIEITEEDYVKHLPLGHPDRILFRKNRIDKLLINYGK